MGERAAARLVLVVGSRNSGKTGYARAVVARARAAGLEVAGFLSVAEWDGDTKARFYLEPLGDGGGRRLLASVDLAADLDLRVGPYHLSSEAFSFADRSLRASLDADLICMDEVGPLELRGGGFRDVLEHLLEEYPGILLVTCRPSVAETLRELAMGTLEIGG